jgi:hypothetical protein
MPTHGGRVFDFSDNHQFQICFIFQKLENCQLRVFFSIGCQIKEPPVQVIRNIINDKFAILMKESVKEPVNTSDPVL